MQPKTTEALLFTYEEIFFWELVQINEHQCLINIFFFSFFFFGTDRGNHAMPSGVRVYFYYALKNHCWWCLEELYGVPGVKPESEACKANTIPVLYYLFSSELLFFNACTSKRGIECIAITNKSWSLAMNPGSVIYLVLESLCVIFCLL